MKSSHHQFLLQCFARACSCAYSLLSVFLDTLDANERGELTQERKQSVASSSPLQYILIIIPMVVNWMRCDVQLSYLPLVQVYVCMVSKVLCKSTRCTYRRCRKRQVNRQSGFKAVYEYSIPSYVYRRHCTCTTYTYQNTTIIIIMVVVF